MGISGAEIVWLPIRVLHPTGRCLNILSMIIIMPSYVVAFQYDNTQRKKKIGLDTGVEGTLTG